MSSSSLPSSPSPSLTISTDPSGATTAPTTCGMKRPAPEEETTTIAASATGVSPSVGSGPNKRPAIEGPRGPSKSNNTVKGNDEPSSASSTATPAPRPTTARASPTGSASTDKSNRGLRHFSMMVCQKVEEKGTTTYNEVADELVKKVIAERRKEDPNGKFDEKNIRRRVYDALNVLMAMDIISKEKKEITWRGLPTADRQDLDALQHEIEYRRYQLRHKKEALKELLTQQVCFRNLVLRNSQVTKLPDDKIPLPFIVVNTNASAVIQCDMSRDRTDVMFDFSMPFEINDDNTILKKMGMNHTSVSTLRGMLPDDLLRYCQKNHLIDGVIGREEPESPVAAILGAVEPIPIGAPALPAVGAGTDGSHSI